LADFAKIVEIFDAAGVSFVSVTQQFNTTTSMGRLTLNVLLSFAQFEREVTGERIRDKIAASKQKGMWMGGWVPIGYDRKDRTLTINETEALTVRTIFDLFLAQTVVERVLKKYQERVIDETAEIYRLKEEIIKAEPDSEEFRIKINELSWKYTSSLKNFDMANLSQLIVRRAAIVEILDLACGKNLAMQAAAEGSRRKDERIIHSIFFPMRRDSADFADHDIWLLSEEYHYYDYIASDMPLANIAWSDDQKVFESDIDQKFHELLARRADDNSSKRPDIALFNKEGSAIIVEFKAPGVPMDEHIGDLTMLTYWPRNLVESSRSSTVI
jgi:hypothetical protein